MAFYNVCYVFHICELILLKNLRLLNMEDHLLKKVWGDYTHLFNDSQITPNTIQIENIIADMMAVGNYYHYVINIKEGTIHNCSNSILDIHGLKSIPHSIQDIIDLIHPEDISFVVEAERMTIEKHIEIGFEHTLNLKDSYCFRMKTANGNYELFHHQAIHIMLSEQGELLRSINIHTNIHHLTPINNYIALVSGIGNRNDFHQMSYKNRLLKNSIPESLTNREREILRHIANGHTSEEISQLFTISNHTVRTHRKNILRKTQTKNSSELIKKCVEWGLL